MVKITEALLLEKGSPKTSKLEEIKSLNLSEMGLKQQDLPVRLLSRLKSLQRCDLSGNRITSFPDHLKLAELQYLDLSDNQMEDVTSLGALSQLEELRLDNNLYITVSDNYKLMVLLPNLRMYNGKDVTSTANHVRFVYTENLQTRVRAVWQKGFSLPDPISANKMAALEINFVKACQQVKFGPPTASNFTKWQMEILAKEYLLSLTSKQEEDLPGSKRKQMTTDAAGLTPSKKTRGHQAVIECPREPCSPSKPPCSKRTAVLSKKDGDRKHSNTTKEGLKTKDVPFGIKSQSQQPVRLKVHHILQCHSRQDSQEDFSTQLWACCFQPQLHANGSTESHLVATCGGDAICIIDCESGLVMKKYKVPGEEFFSLAWSIVMMSAEGQASAQHCIILAAGGKRGLVKLIHPRNKVAYGEFRASRKALSVLRFHPRKGNFLFTGSYDKKVVMWDIGGLNGHYNYKVVQLLTLETSDTPLLLALPPSSPDTHLLAACEDGLLCYNTQLSSSKPTKRSKEMEITFPIYEKEDKNNNYHTVDGLSFLADDVVASKNLLHNCIYLWSWPKTKTQRPDRNQAVAAVILAKLKWTETEIPYLALSTCPGRGFVACGDDKGRLWTYNLSDLQGEDFQKGKPVEPTEVLDWPKPLRKDKGTLVDGPSINNLTMDTNLKYLVTLSDQNLVTVWKNQH